jgi:hypothetical protein
MAWLCAELVKLNANACYKMANAVFAKYRQMPPHKITNLNLNRPGFPGGSLV